ESAVEIVNRLVRLDRGGQAADSVTKSFGGVTRYLRSEVWLIARGEAPGNDHPPGVKDQLAHLLLIECGQARQHPLVTKVGLARLHELVRGAADQPVPLILWKRKAHHALVARERQVEIGSA